MCNPDAELLPAALSGGVTLVTVNAVVDVTRYLIVLEVVRIVVAMTARALEHRVVIRVDMACRTNVVRIPMTGRELRVLRVVERRVSPTRSVVAVLACCWEKLRLRLMSRVRRVVVVRCMAAVAIRRQRCVVVVDVTIHAMPRRRLVRTSQWECRVVVIER